MLGYVHKLWPTGPILSKIIDGEYGWWCICYYKYEWDAEQNERYCF